MTPATVMVIKRDHEGREVRRYTGTLIARGETWACVEAFFASADVDAGVMVFRRGDRMTEWFYADRMYNVFRVQAVDDDRLKGWYCNITRPAQITDSDGQTIIAADDLALDVFVSPVGDVLVLDEDEFAALDLPPAEQNAAREAVEQIRRLAADHVPPFDAPA
jgi:hypothetical protein